MNAASADLIILLPPNKLEESIIKIGVLKNRDITNQVFTIMENLHKGKIEFVNQTDTDNPPKVLLFDTYLGSTPCF